MDALALISLWETIYYEWCACRVRAVGEGLTRCVLCEAEHVNRNGQAPRPTT